MTPIRDLPAYNWQYATGKTISFRGAELAERRQATHFDGLRDTTVACVEKIANGRPGRPAMTVEVARELGVCRATALNWLKLALEAGLLVAEPFRPGMSVGLWRSASVPICTAVEMRNSDPSVFVNSHVVEAAQCVLRLANGRPVRTKAVAAALSIHKDTATKRLRRAVTAGLVKSVGLYRGWEPVANKQAEPTD